MACDPEGIAPTTARLDGARALWRGRLPIAWVLAVGLGVALPAASQFVVPGRAPTAWDRPFDFSPPTTHAERAIQVPRVSGHLGRQQLGLVINTADPYSVEVGEYYMHARGLTSRQVLRLALPVRAVLTPQEFETFAEAVDRYFEAPIEALALAWSAPYAVQCNSITGALALGYDAALCAQTCAASTPSRYFNSASLRPHRDLRMRPAMLLAAADVGGARAMIQRGVSADGQLGMRGGPSVNAYFVTTDDRARSVRAPYFPPEGRVGAVVVHRSHGTSIGDAERVVMYETGLTQVPDLARIHWVNGALADHLTSYGGVLDGSGGQMTVLDWIAAGATASYGTVSEPCSRVQKFPNPQVLLLNYLLGATAIEAYWKSVAWPQQGLFVGEPLAAPFARRPNGPSP